MASRLERTECSRVMQTAQDGSRVDSSKHGHKEVANKYAIQLFTHCCPFKLAFVCSGFSVSIVRTSCYSRLMAAGSLSLFCGITSCHYITPYNLASSAIRRSVVKLRERDTRRRSVHQNGASDVVGARPRIASSPTPNRTSSPARVDQQLTSLATVTIHPPYNNSCNAYNMV
jgi:hypothetical protein